MSTIIILYNYKHADGPLPSPTVSLPIGLVELKLVKANQASFFSFFLVLKHVFSVLYMENDTIFCN